MLLRFYKFLNIWFYGVALKQRLLSFYIFLILIIVASFALEHKTLENNHPGYNVHDCKRSIEACNRLLGGGSFQPK